MLPENTIYSLTQDDRETMEQSTELLVSAAASLSPTTPDVAPVWLKVIIKKERMEEYLSLVFLIYIFTSLPCTSLWCITLIGMQYYLLHPLSKHARLKPEMLLSACQRLLFFDLIQSQNLLPHTYRCSFLKEHLHCQFRSFNALLKANRRPQSGLTSWSSNLSTVSSPLSLVTNTWPLSKFRNQHSMLEICYYDTFEYCQKTAPISNSNLSHLLWFVWYNLHQK